MTRRGYRTCVYQITNLVSGNIYIGSATNYPTRKGVHLNTLRNGCHANRYLQNAYDKYGEDKLEFKKLIICSRDDLLFYEQKAIDLLNPKYNLHRVAGSPKGYLHSEETKEKMRASRASLSEEKKARIANAPRTKGGHSHEGRAAIAKAMAERVVSEETRKKTSMSVGKFTEQDVLEIRRLRSSGEKLITIAKKYSTSEPVIHKIAKGETYRWV